MGGEAQDENRAREQSDTIVKGRIPPSWCSPAFVVVRPFGLALAGEDTPVGRAFLVDIPTGPGTAG